MQGSVVIIGAGHAGVQAAWHLRQRGFSGAIHLFSAERRLPYQRPPLSKAFLAGAMKVNRLLLRGAVFYREANITLHLGEPALALEPAANRLRTSRGEYIYDTAIIATGGRPRAWAKSMKGMFYLHDMAESKKLKAALSTARAIAIIGGGYIGLEVAATARQMGVRVLVLEAAPRILARVAAPEISDFFTDYHRQKGVQIELGAQCALSGAAHLEGVKYGDDFFPADLALIGIGMQPEIGLAEAAGLAIDNGIIVDQQQRSSHPAIYAIGDCARAPHPLYDRAVRLESVQNALYQADIAAAAICQAPPPKIETPWFWSDQYEVKLQIAGLSQGYRQTITRGDIARKSFAVLYLDGDRLLAADCINRPQEFLMSQRVIAAKGRVDPAQLGDDSLHVKTAFAPVIS